MSGIGGFRGVSASQDARFVNKQKRMLKTKKFPKELDVVVDYARVNWAVIREWTAKRLTELLGVEDEVLIQFIHNRLEELHDLNPKELYLELMPFLEKNTGLFMKELWTLLASAAANETGIPQQILDAKAEEVRQKIEQQSTIIESIEEQRKKAKLETQSAELDTKEDAQKEPQLKKDKNKRWVPPPRTEPMPQRGPLPPFREKGSRFSGGPDHVRRQRRDRWRDRSYSPPQKRRRTPKGRPASRSRSPRRRHDVKSRPSRKPHRRSRSPDRSPSWERNRARRSRSPKLDRNRRRPSNERKHSGRGERDRRVKPVDHSLSRSPPQSRHSSPPPRPYNLPLARRREPHDRKSRSIEPHVSSRSPPTKSPSPRSRNRMSSTPDPREGTPSPSTRPSPGAPLSTTSPIPKPATPRTRTPPVRNNRHIEPERRTRGVRPFGSMYAFPDEDDAFCDRTRRPPRRTPSPAARRHRMSGPHRPNHRPEEGRRRRDEYSRGYVRFPSDRRFPSDDRQRGRRGYAYRSPQSPPGDRFPSSRGRHRDPMPSLRSSANRDRVYRSASPEKGHRRTHRRHLSKDGHRDRGTKITDIEREAKKPDSDSRDESFSDRETSKMSGSNTDGSQDSDEQTKTKEKLKRKLSEILEKKDSLNLDNRTL